MAYSGSELTAEIRKLIDDKIERGDVAPASWITIEITGRHKTIQGEDAEFHFYCAQHWVREQVSAALKHYNCKVKPKADPQLVLPGYEYLQRAYLVTRDEQQVVAPIDALSTTEIEAKAAELESMAAGATKHAAELRRYGRKRRAG